MPRTIWIRATRMKRMLMTLLIPIVLAGCSTTDDQINSGLWHFNAGLHAQAIPRLLSGAESLQKSTPADPRLPSVLMALGNMAEEAKRADLAERYYQQAIQSVDEFHSKDDIQVRNALVQLGLFYSSVRRYSDAIPLLTRATHISAKTANINNRYAIDLDNLSLAVIGDGRQADAMMLNDEALQALKVLPQTAENIATRGVVHFNRAYALAEQGNNVAAEDYYLHAITDISSSSEAWRMKIVRESYAAFLRKMGRVEEANTIEPAKP